MACLSGAAIAELRLMYWVPKSAGAWKKEVVVVCVLMELQTDDSGRMGERLHQVSVLATIRK